MSSNSSDYRKRTQRKGMVTTIIAGVVIVGAVIAIIVAIIALSSKDSTKDKTSDTNATTAASEAESGSTQPTLYRGDTASTQPLPTTTPAAQNPTEKAASPATQAPTTAPAETPDDTDNDTPIDPGAAETPAENVDNSGTGRIRNEAPLNTYTDDSGVLHVITPAGYNWTYQCDGSHVTITCDPHDGQYDFLITGIAPGSEDITPQYFVREDKTAWVAVPLTVTVDENLRVTVAG